MTVYFAAAAPDNLPSIEYSMVNEEQAASIQEAMTLPENQAKFDVTLLPVDTPEQRRAAAEEWAAYELQAGNTETKERGAVFFISGRDRSSPEYFLGLLEGHDRRSEDGGFVIKALLKIVLKKRDADTWDLLRTYYGDKTNN